MYIAHLSWSFWFFAQFTWRSLCFIWTWYAKRSTKFWNYHIWSKISIFFSCMKQLHDPDGIIILLLMSVCVAMSILLIYCFGGKFATDQFQRMFDCLYDLNWPELPFKLQKYIILMFSSMQRPIYYHGFGVVYLDLNTFTQVCSYIFHRTPKNTNSM